MDRVNPPELEGVTHRYVDLPNGLRVHVAEHGAGERRSSRCTAFRSTGTSGGGS